jgi:hypothetical protein
MGVPQFWDVLYRMENPMKINDLGLPHPFMEISICYISNKAGDLQPQRGDGSNNNVRAQEKHSCIHSVMINTV